MNIKKAIVQHRSLYNFLHFFYKLKMDISLHIRYRKAICKKRDKDRVYYLGIPAHSNLGDLAQGVCIRKWLKKHYNNYDIVEIETNALVNNRWSLIPELKKNFAPNDFIVFQSGYTTTDLGGFADEMHRAVIQAMPQAKMLMMPQTIFFQNIENEKKTAQIYSSASHMLFLARDRISFEKANTMFRGITVMKFPDIVTTLIGSENHSYKRNGILFCCRDDGEKYYSDEEIDVLMNRCSEFASVSKTDTTKGGNAKEIVKNAEALIYNEIDDYSHYKLIITDRYHGTILSLVAGTPIIILKTTDHKVITGA